MRVLILLFLIASCTTTKLPDGKLLKDKNIYPSYSMPRPQDDSVLSDHTAFDYMSKDTAGCGTVDHWIDNGSWKLHYRYDTCAIKVMPIPDEDTARVNKFNWLKN